MPILLEEPIERPAVPSKIYDAVWLYNLMTNCPSLTIGNVIMEILPFNTSTGEIGPRELGFTVKTDDLFLAVNQVQEVAVAFQAVLNAIIPLKNWVESQNTPPNPE